MSDRLLGKAAVVVGAGSVGEGWGNGKATAVLMAREGAKVLCADLNERAALETAALIKAEGGEAVALQVDASSEPDILAMVKVANETFGGSIFSTTTWESLSQVELQRQTWRLGKR